MMQNSGLDLSGSRQGSFSSH